MDESPNAPRSVSLVDVLIILLEKKKLIIISMLAISIATLLLTMLIPKEYQAVAVLLPSTGRASQGLGSLVSELPVSGMLKNLNLFPSNDNDQVISILGSRRLALLVIDHFDLKKRYGFLKNPKKKVVIEDVLRKFSKNYRTSETDLKNLEITFVDTNPVFSSEVVNYVVRQLDSISYEISRDQARNSRIFFEDRLQVIKKDLDSAHARFSNFKIAHNYLDLDEQVNATVKAFSEIQARILSTDVQIDLLRSKFISGSEQVHELEGERQILQRRMSEYMDKGSGELLLPLRQTPTLGVQYVYLMRDVKVQEMLYSFVLQMYEQAKMTEVNNTPVVNVLEWADPPQKKLRPKRGIICLYVFFLSFSLLSLLIVFRKYSATTFGSDTAQGRKLQQLVRHLREWK